MKNVLLAFVVLLRNLKVSYCRELFLLDLFLLQSRSGCCINAVKISKLHRKVRPAQIQKLCLLTSNQNFHMVVISQLYRYHSLLRPQLGHGCKNTCRAAVMNLLFKPRYDGATKPCLQFCLVAICCIANIENTLTGQLKLQTKSTVTFYCEYLIQVSFVIVRLSLS